tara:strand:+ start:2634 stop:2903 length:270 start_codon:yes stop_codon:yes gene_type:complete
MRDALGFGFSSVGESEVRIVLCEEAERFIQAHVARGLLRLYGAGPAAEGSSQQEHLGRVVHSVTPELLCLFGTAWVGGSRNGADPGMYG